MVWFDLLLFINAFLNLEQLLFCHRLDILGVLVMIKKLIKYGIDSMSYLLIEGK
jgi:hypothetical protein